MARKKLSTEDIVSNHYHFVINYFDRAIRNRKILIYSDTAYEAKDEFNKNLLYANKNESTVPLSDWIDKHITPEEWVRCKTAIRQHKLMEVKKQKYEYKTFRIPNRLFYDIGYYAEKAGLTKFAAMQQAIDIATKLLDANGNKSKKK